MKMNDFESDMDARSADRFEVEEATVSYRGRGLWARIMGGVAAESSLPVRNFSGRGICFMCEQRLKGGQRLEMVIKLRGEQQSLPVSGVVVWVGQGNHRYPQRAGVRFTRIGLESARRLAAVFERLRTREKARAHGSGPGEGL